MRKALNKAKIVTDGEEGRASHVGPEGRGHRQGLGNGEERS